MTKPKCKLRIEREKFMFMLKFALIGKRKKVRNRAYLSYVNNELQLEYLGAKTGVPAEGTWQGVLEVDVEFLKNLQRYPLREETLEIVADEDHLHIGSLSIGCHWVDAPEEILDLSTKTSFMDLLSISLCQTDEIIEKNGLTKTIGEAIERRDKILDRAAKTLKPLEITKRQLVDILEERIRKEYQEKQT
jgi:hypothetical protein